MFSKCIGNCVFLQHSFISAMGGLCFLELKPFYFERYLEIKESAYLQFLCYYRRVFFCFVFNSEENYSPLVALSGGGRIALAVIFLSLLLCAENNSPCEVWWFRWDNVVKSLLFSFSLSPLGIFSNCPVRREPSNFHGPLFPVKTLLWLSALISLTPFCTSRLIGVVLLATNKECVRLRCQNNSVRLKLQGVFSHKGCYFYWTNSSQKFLAFILCLRGSSAELWGEHLCDLLPQMLDFGFVQTVLVTCIFIAEYLIKKKSMNKSLTPLTEIYSINILTFLFLYIYRSIYIYLYIYFKR